MLNINYLTTNLLPKQGKIIYISSFLSQEESNSYFDQLYERIPWQSDRIYMYGKMIETKRKFCWMANQAYAYRYSKTVRTAIPWNEILSELKSKLEAKIPYTFNSCLLNRYLDGSEAMGWHSDNESCMLKHGAIASLSFGATRTMEFKHKITGELVSLQLEHGSLLIMLDETQEYWLHQIKKTSKVKTPRINLTFRTFVEIM